MKVALSSTQAIYSLNRHFGVTNITNAKLKALIETGALTDIGIGRNRKIDSDELDTFMANTRYVKRKKWPTKHLFRVSIVALREDFIHSNGVMLRQFAGVDYAHRTHPHVSGKPRPLTPTENSLAWEGVWQVSDAAADKAVTKRATLFGTTKGYIGPEQVRTITGWHRTPGTRDLWWETTDPTPEVRAFVGTGLWMDVKNDGRESNWA